MHRWLFVLGTVLAVGGCDWAKTEKGCPQGPGLSQKTLLGQDLAPQTIALAFDGGPSDGTGALADFLFIENASSVFFVSGASGIERTNVLAHIKGRGHLVANGGYSGKSLLNVSEPILEVTRTDAIISPYVAGNAFLLRFPADGFDDSLITNLNDAGFRKYVGPVGSDVKAPEECQTSDASACAQAYLRDIRRAGQGIVAVPEDKVDALEVTKVIVQTLKNEGFAFVRIDEVPGIRLALEASGAKPGMVSGPEGCSDYE